MHFSNSLFALAGLAEIVMLAMGRMHVSFPRALNSSGQVAAPQDFRNVSAGSGLLPTGTCNAQTPCANGACCGKDNLCGYSPKSCGTGCQHNCDAKAQCGPYAAAGTQRCPLNVCCSEYGFCGSTPEFCSWTTSHTGDPNYATCSSAYGSCGDVKRPSCASDRLGTRNIGYYESKWPPEDLNLDGFTSINFAFAFFDPTTFVITSMDANAASLYSRFTALKSKKPGLEAFISIGGWSFTDPGATQTAFSRMVSSAGNRDAFIRSLVQFMDTYGFDGVDLDWEYPGADDRGGVATDTANFVALAAELKAAFGGKYGLTVTLPTSYWYLQHFDVNGLQPHVDWFNLMAYDLHGTWDNASVYVGPFVAPHTNLTEIDAALDLLWRAGIDPGHVVLGQGWYGRSFTLADPACNTPNGVCRFSGAAYPGPCSKAAGILDYQEIASLVASQHMTPSWDKTAGVKWITWNHDQWVSYDDADTFTQKREFAGRRCLGGTMVWAMDQVDQKADNGFGGAPAAANAHVTPAQQQSAADASADMLASVKCYACDCGGGCKPGTVQVAQFNGQPDQLSTNARCPKKAYRSLCCDAASTMGTCQWRGYRGAGLGCLKGCAAGETELTTNTNQHDGKKGDKDCHGGLQSFCCAGFRPTTKRLEDDLADAAKAAAEALAQQAALDLAAKAFCRVAVPALLVPLELLEDLIPIVGEIMDLIEIAATPAIIEGCVKGIEKAGKAEFKVKPEGVPSRPVPKDGDHPTQTADKNGKSDRCERETKRSKTLVAAGKPTKTSYIDKPRMEKLIEHSGYPSDHEWKHNDGFAMRLMFPVQYTMGMSPKHYAIVAGYVKVTKRPGRPEAARDRCGRVTHYVQTAERDWLSNGYDQLGGPVVKFSGSKDEYPIENQGVFGMAWDQEGSVYMRLYVVWSPFGKIRRRITYEDVEHYAASYCSAYPEYDYLANNCKMFAEALYRWMRETACWGNISNKASQYRPGLPSADRHDMPPFHVLSY
ncbi:class 5 chitinase 1 [Sporothrix schenckii 1099-18]|uniref:chitinase n=1 Tax=Sporothrix schenckii 1099-18 TaxID=1397361 RepID=A0A0F2MAG9_SPOSC|nr:class 5 chitinase 1 [Sporothrix schenckii 1099-18]KJR85825.1 class 5 chitinase 1 [Sporothrix schenckii 1099-18]